MDGIGFVTSTAHQVHRSVLENQEPGRLGLLLAQWIRMPRSRVINGHGHGLSKDLKGLC